LIAPLVIAEIERTRVNTPVSAKRKPNTPIGVVLETRPAKITAIPSTTRPAPRKRRGLVADIVDPVIVV
jgi:hypothetical protein